MMNKKRGLKDSVSCPTMEIPGRRISYRKGTSRQRSGKGAIRKRFPLQIPRWKKNTIRYLNQENTS